MLIGIIPEQRSASPEYAVPGVPPDRNLNGISFAVANMTGFVARVRAACPPGDVRARLIQEAS